jgi:hypothetical protein
MIKTYMDGEKMNPDSYEDLDRIDSINFDEKMCNYSPIKSSE